MYNKILSKHMRYIASFVAVVTLVAIPLFAFGQQVDFGTDYLTGVGLGTQDIRTTIVKLLRISFGILGAITLVLIVYAGFIWMTSAGKQDVIAKAKKIIINAVIGLIIIVTAATITEFIFSKIQEATTPTNSGNTCAPANSCVSACSYCNASGVTVFDNSCGNCALGSNQFELRDVQTAHGGTDQKQDVYLCSQIQPQFNNTVDSATLPGNAKVTDLSGVEISGTWIASGNILNFSPDNNFAPNRDYEVRLTSTLADASGDYLAGCNGTNCESAPPIFPYYGWQFRTGVDTDTTSPTIERTYPKLDGTSRTVSRSPTIDVTYSESINFLSIADTDNPPNPQVSKFILQALDGPGGNPVGQPIDNVDLTAISKSDGFRVKIDSDSSLLLDSFTWYRIIVQDITDLCANNQQPSPEIWEFQTNDSVPGVVSKAPTGTNSCPSETILFTFGTALYNELIVLDVNGQFITLQPTELDLSTTVAGFGTLKVLDPSYPPEPVNGNYRNYEFIPENPWITDTTYSVTVTAPDLVVDNDGNTLYENWQFGVGTAGSCTCSPYITKLSPTQGVVGQCTTVYGRCFAGANDNPGALSVIRFVDPFNNATGAVIKGQDATFATTDVPLSLGPDTYNVEVDLTYNDSNYGVLTSNKRQFLVQTGDAYTGPCLTLIDPSKACYGKTITLEGEDFGADPGEPNRDTAINNVNFSASGNIPDTVGSSAFKSWSDTKTEFDLPNGFLSSDVTLTAGGLTSNSLPFDLACNVPGDGSGGNQFILNNYWPGCDTSCPNAGIGASFSKEIDASTVTNASISVFSCSDGATCKTLVDVSKTWEITNGNKDIDINAGLLNNDAYYRVVIRSSVSDTTGIPLTNLNYDESADGNDDSYSWTFKTKTGGCTPTSVDVVPDNISFGAVGDTQSIYGRVLSNQGCYGNQPLISSDYDWFWTENNAAVINVTYNDLDNNGKTDPNQNVTSRGVGSADVIGKLNKTSIEDRTPVVVSLNFAIKSNWPSCTTACMNSEIGAEFYSDVDDTSVVPGSISLFECIDGVTCSVFASTNPIFTTTVTTKQIILQPTVDLKSTTYYRVIYRDVLRGTNGQNLTGLNYDENADDVDDSYSWTFQTNDKVCDITGVTTQPGKITFSSISQTKDIVGKAVSNQGCYGGQFVDAWDYNWSWSIDDVSVATLQSPLADVNNDTNIDPVQSITSQTASSTTVTGNAGGFDSTSDIEVLDDSGLPVSCDGNTATPSCEPNSNKCSSTDYCNPTSCSCEIAPAPTILSIEPKDKSDLECRNSSFKIVFDQLMNSSEGNKYIELMNFDIDILIDTNISSYNIDSGSENCTWEDGCTVFIVSPVDLLPADVPIGLRVKAGIPSIYEQGLETTQANTYTVGSSICQLNGVDISPSSWMFTSLLFPDNSHDFVSRGYTNQGGRVYIVPTPDYDWNWNWTREDPGQFITTSENIDTNNVTVIKSGIGNAYITSEATIITDNVFGGAEVGKKESGTAVIDIFICDFPWPSPPPYNIGWNATMKYCRGNIGDNLLPVITETANFPVSGTLLRDTIFTVDESDGLTGKDIIGLRVYDNPTHASASGWYASQDFQQGSPSETVIDGYPAVVDGRTIYIHFTDVEKSNPDKIRSYILVLSHNQNESRDTRSIYSKLVKSFLFNNNIINTEKKFIQQDMIRMGGLGFIAEKLLDYQANNAGTLPDLSSGTFVNGMSTSRWPQSWQSILGNALGTKMPLDPDNNFSFCPDNYDQQSCFNNNFNPQFYCADSSHIYIYKDGSIYANPKYKNVEWVGVGTVTGNTCASFGLSTVGGVIGQAPALSLGALPPEVDITSPNNSSSGDQNISIQYSTTQSGDVVFYANNIVYGSTSVGIGSHAFTYSDLSAGNNNLKVEMSNIYGNGSDNIDYTVEFIALSNSITINNPKEGEIGGVDVTVDYTLEGNGTVVCKVDTGKSFSTKNVNTGTYSCPTFSHLAEGNRTFTVTYTPSGAGSSISDSVHYTVTTDVVTIDNPASGTSGGNSLTVTYTMNAGSSVECRDDTGVVYTTGNGPGTYICTLNNLPVGTRTITVKMLGSGVMDSIQYIVQPGNKNVASSRIIKLAKLVGSVLRGLF